jgi:hypothetical protein
MAVLHCTPAFLSWPLSPVFRESAFNTCSQRNEVVQMRTLMAILCVLGACVSVQAAAAQVEVFDRATGQVLLTYRYKGQTYVAGEAGHEYELRIRSNSGQRVLAVATVDGVNVVTGQTGALDQAGYVLDPYGFARIEGWRKSMSRTAAFYFTKLPNSYAAKTGRPDNVGVIGVALFNERVQCCRWQEELSRKELDREPMAPSAAAPKEQGLASADKSERAKRDDSKLGTGHGRSEYSAAQYTEFERASDKPDEIISIYYDSQRNLLAQGIIPTPQRYSQRVPQPFPGGFVPDP